MIKQNKTKLQFILGGAVMLTLAVAACNNTTEKEPEKTIIVTPPVKDTIDTMVKMPGSVAPVTDVPPK